MFLGGREGFINMMLSTGSKPDIKTFTQLLYTIGPNIEEEKVCLLFLLLNKLPTLYVGSWYFLFFFCFQLLMTQMNQLGIKRDLDFCNMLIKKRNINNNFPGAKVSFILVKNIGIVCIEQALSIFFFFLIITY